MKTLIHVVLLTCGLGAYGQKVADIDLTQHLPTSRLIQQSTLPKECEAPQFTNSDGAIVSQDGRPEVELQLNILNGGAFAFGDRIRSQVVMRNIGTRAVEIPWTADPQIGSPRAGSLQHEYGLGWFEVGINRKDGSTIRLESESVSNFLYSSPSAPGTALRLEPGQWIVARFDFLLEQDRKLSSRPHLERGNTDLVIHWRQALHRWQRDNCKIETEYYSYDHKEETKPVRIEIWERPFDVIP